MLFQNKKQEAKTRNKEKMTRKQENIEIQEGRFEQGIWKERSKQEEQENKRTRKQKTKKR